MTRVRIAALATVLWLGLAGPAAAQGGGLLVDAGWLHAHLNDADLRVVDMTDAKDYRRGHVPGAVHLSLEAARVKVAAGGYRLPTADELARLVGDLGIGPDTHVVIYDDSGGLDAARFFFTLDVFGHRAVSILDGGIAAWRRGKLPLTIETARVARTAYRPVLLADRVASAEWVREHLTDATVALLDARTAAEYAGQDVRARRGGHVPGSVNVEWQQNLRPDGTFKSREELSAMYAAQAVTPDKTVVTYCQTHHRAAHSYFVLRLLGYPRLVGYDRSWSEWGNRDDLPIAR
ncbi:MAG: thiosulfate sulfurtransferase [Candidatus Rokuibacteriota bacterium]|nr:MAG: thiosulfate sulfurtransferase [Candidatus Rokubacteria bacterium]